MKLYLAYIADYDAHREIGVCDTLEQAKQLCQNDYTSRKKLTREIFNNDYLVSIGQDKVRFSKNLVWSYQNGKYVADFPHEGRYRICEIELNKAIAS